MESGNFEQIINVFNQIDIENEPGSEKYNIYVRNNSWDLYYKPRATRRYIPPKYIDFELYVKENCQSKINILNRATFHEINQPKVIFFNHFREKCAHHTGTLNEMFELALKYDQRIVFIAADIMDIDILYPGRNQLHFLSRKLRVEQQHTLVYAVDEKYRIYKYSEDIDKSVLELCENLLNGKLYPSLPVPENNKTDLIKVAVELNYKEMLMQSTNNIFLIVNSQPYELQEPKLNYEMVALTLKNYNLDFIYMEGERNYIPFEYYIEECYPTLIFIPAKDKNNYIYYERPLREEDIIEFLLDVIEYPDYLELKQQQLKNRRSRRTVQVPDDFQIDFQDLPQFLKDNFEGTFKVLDPEFPLHAERYRYYFIVYMDFFDMKCYAKHIQWLNKIYPLALDRFLIYELFVADFKDIGVINSKWKPKDLIATAQGKPKIYAFDYLKHTYEFGNFECPNKFFYFTASLESNQLYYSQIYPRTNIGQLVKQWTSDYFKIFLNRSKKHIFITFYTSGDKNVENLLNFLDLIAEDVKDLNVEVAKFDVDFNYVDLEYAQDKYPVYYFIPHYNKRESRLYIDKDLSRDKMVAFIKNNVEKN